MLSITPSLDLCHQYGYHAASRYKFEMLVTYAMFTHAGLTTRTESKACIYKIIFGFFAVIYSFKELDDMKLEQIILYYSQNLNP